MAIPESLRRVGAWLSLIAMGGLIAVQVWQDVGTLLTMSLRERISSHSLTSVELVLLWGAVGLALYALGRRIGNHKAWVEPLSFDQQAIGRESQE